MSQLQISRDGSVLHVKNQDVPFSLWPTARQTRRYKLQSRIFTSDPWALMAEGIADLCPKRSKEAAHAFRAQAEDFFDAAIAMGSRNLWAKPLLLYYAFLNLSRAYLLTWGFSNPTERPHHGIAEKARIRQVEGTRLTVHPSRPRNPQLFDQLLKALTGHGLKARKSYRLGYLMPQILFGHRVWCSASDEHERFLPIRAISYIDNRDRKELWTRIHVSKEELSKCGLTQAEALGRARMKKDWTYVRDPDDGHGLCIEERAPHIYSHRPSDVLMSATDSIRPYLWTSVLLHPPYRKYYLYLAPPEERSSVLPQLLSMYTVIFLLGSITRYQPHQFENLLDTQYGAHLIGALTEIPNQYIYLMASEFLKREVTRASLA
jgi:hypothetical protein